MEPFPARGALIAGQIDEHRIVAFPHLSQKEGVGDLRCLNELRKDVAVRLRELREIHTQVGRRKPVGHALELGWLGRRRRMR